MFLIKSCLNVTRVFDTRTSEMCYEVSALYLIYKPLCLWLTYPSTPPQGNLGCTQFWLNPPAWHYAFQNAFSLSFLVHIRLCVYNAKNPCSNQRLLFRDDFDVWIMSLFAISNCLKKYYITFIWKKFTGHNILI